MKRNLDLVKSIFCAFTSCCMGFLFLLPVHADYDYEFYYPDPDSYTAYEYFINHGYSDLILSSSGTEAVSYNVNLKNKNNLTQGTGYYDHGTITGTETTTGTINSHDSTLGARYMVCTTNNAVTGTQTYSCYFSSRQNGVENSQSVTIKLNENTSTSVNDSFNIGTINEDGSTTGTISANVAFKNRLYAKIPKLSGTYSHTTAYSSSDFFNARKNVSFYLIFMAKKLANPTFNAYGQNGSTDFTVNASRSSMASGWTMYYYQITSTSSSGVNVTLDIDWLNNDDIIPIFCGKETFLTDSIRERVGMKTKTNTLIDEGNDDTAGKVQNTKDKTTDLNSKFTQFDNLENTQVQNMEYRLNNINTVPNILSNSKFLVSAKWVRSCFNHITNNTPFGSVLGFSLLLGLAMIFLGKFR